MYGEMAYQPIFILYIRPPVINYSHEDHKRSFIEWNDQACQTVASATHELQFSWAFRRSRQPFAQCPGTGNLPPPTPPSEPKKDEIFLLLRGRIAVFLFDNKGEITQTQILDPKEGVYGAEIKAGTWHGLLVLESGSVIYEIKEGPFAPLAPENFAPWSPAPEDTKGVAKYMELLGKAI